ANSTVREGEYQSHAIVRRTLSGCSEMYGAGFGKLYCIVGKVFEHRPQTQCITRHHGGKITGDPDFPLKGLVFPTGGEWRTNAVSDDTWRERLVAEHKSLGIGLGRVDYQRGQRSQVVGAALYCVCPFPFARTQVGGGQ